MIAKTERTIVKKCRTLEEAEARAAKVKLKAGDPRIVEIAFYPVRYRASHQYDEAYERRGVDIQNSAGTYEVALVAAGGEGWNG